MATSLTAVSARPLDEDSSRRLIPAILGHFELALKRLADGDPSLPEEWNRLDLLRDTWVRVDLGTRHVAGRGQGIDHGGALCLDDGRGSVRVFGGRVIRRVPGSATPAPASQRPATDHAATE